MEFERVDPIVVALAVALSTRQPVGTVLGIDAPAGTPARGGGAGAASRPREATPRGRRSKNRKG